MMLINANVSWYGGYLRRIKREKMKEFEEFIDSPRRKALKSFFEKLNEEDGIMLESMFYAFYESQKSSIPVVSDTKKFNIHECLNDLENAFKERTALFYIIDKKRLRFEMKKAIDKMICCR